MNDESTPNGLPQSTALLSVGKVRSRYRLASSKWPTFCDRLHFGAPTRPRLVVMTMTPDDALEPYMADADAPLSTSIVSMSLGLMSAIRFGLLSCSLGPTPPSEWLIVLSPLLTVSLFT